MYNEVNASPIKLFFHQKWVRIVLALDIIVIIIVIGIAIYNSMKTAVVTFNVTPIDATIFVGNDIYENGTYKLSPGSYDVAIIHPDLDSKYFHLDLAGDSSTLVATFLSATDEDGEASFDFYTLKSNYYSYQSLASMASKSDNKTTDHDPSAEDFIAKMEKTLSIFSKLPILGYVHADPTAKGPTAGFSIRNGADDKECTKIACLLVMNYGEGIKEAVAEKITESGYNPTDYEIFYERYKQ